MADNLFRVVGSLWAFPTEEMKELMGDFLHKTRYLQWVGIAVGISTALFLTSLTIVTLSNIFH